MKYWVYLNDEVSQKPYTEEELQKLDGFGVDVLICCETSTVGKDPDWKPAREFFPYLVRPKAPNFSKFRPKPPVTVNKENSNPLPKNEVLPTVVNTTPTNEQKSEQKTSTEEVNKNLLDQINNLMTKIASLETKISEQEKELALANTMFHENELAKEETFVSEPENDQEDDVLEVPFENDFEVPFDANKSSEEIAKEAEAMLSKPMTTEIEEYNADEQNTEMLDYSSDMQKILEDTIRETHRSTKKNDKEEENKKNTRTRTFIAEDLVSNKTFNFSVIEETDKEEEKSADQESAEDETKEQQNTPFEDPNKDLNEELNDDNSQNDSSDTEEFLEGEEIVESLDELLQNSDTENKSENLVDSNNQQSTVSNDLHDLRTEETKQEETPVQSQLATIDTLSDIQAEETKQEKTPVQSQLATIDTPYDIQAKETKQEKTPVQSQLATIDTLSDIQAEETKQEKTPVQVQLPNLEDSDNKINVENLQEPESQGLLESEISENTEGVSLEEHPSQELDSDISNETVKNDDLKTSFVGEINIGEPSDIVQELNPEELTEESKEQIAEGNQAKEEYKVQPEINPEDDIQKDSSKENEIEISSQDKTKTDISDDNLSDISMTQGVTISKDDMTASVLNEIAQEKAKYVPTETTSSQLFKELEDTYKSKNSETDNTIEEKAYSSENQEVNTDENVEAELTKEDEFLKTFTTSVEEVFLDQPTEIISDYVPPSEDTNNFHKSDVVDNNIKRQKPSDIKTVPLVPESMEQEIWSSPYVESATAKLGKKSVLANLGKWILLILLFSILGVSLLSGLAVFHIIPETISPIHKVIYSLSKTPQENDSNVIDTDLSPEIAEYTEIPTEKEETQPVEDNTAVVIQKVKNYMIADTTLESKIKSAHPNLNEELEWIADTTDEQNIYTIVVKVPQGNEGQGFYYRFNYNLAENKLIPTTSGANNIMENY